MSDRFARYFFIGRWIGWSYFADQAHLIHSILVDAMLDVMQVLANIEDCLGRLFASITSKYELVNFIFASNKNENIAKFVAEIQS